MGIDGARLHLVWASAAEGQQLAREINRIVRQVRASVRWTGPATGTNTRNGSRRSSVSPSKPRTRPRWADERAANGKLAIYWAASCGGCEIAVLGIQEKILDVAAAFDIVFWPCVMDAKVRDVEAMPDKSIDVCLFNGGIRTSEQEYMAQLDAATSRKVLVAFGSCAHEGCIPGLANLATASRSSTPPISTRPPTVNPDRVRAADAQPTWTASRCSFPSLLRHAEDPGADRPGRLLPARLPAGIRTDLRRLIAAILEGKLPEAGIGHRRGHDRLRRVRPKARGKEASSAFKRTWQVIPDSETCLLEQGLICCGIATRAGCGALCPEVNSPCIGCYGPNDGVEDFGARMMTRAGLDHRLRRSGGDRPDHPRGDSRPGGHVLPLRAGREPAASREPRRRRRHRPPRARGESMTTSASPSIRSPVSRATARSTSSSTTPATWPTPSCRSPSCAASSASASAGRPRRCPT